MKKFLFLIGILIILSNCKKDEPSLPVIGRWELRTTNGGFAGKQDYPPGNGHVYEFSENQYKLYIDGEVSDHGDYKIIKRKSIRLDGSIDAEWDITLKNDTLAFSSNQSWGAVYSAYVKVN